MGGHLSWFEIGGHRWHAKPAINFLNKMAFEVDIDAPASLSNGTTETDPATARFDPLRRKWQM